MKKIILFLGIFLAGALLFTCAPKAVPVEKPKPIPAVARVAWEEEWERTMTKAGKEGKVVLYTGIGSELRVAFTKAFKEATGITAEFIYGGNKEIPIRLFQERRVGLYLADVFLGGSSTAFHDLKPGGVFEPIRDTLILPEVTVPKSYFGEHLPFMDTDEKFLLVFRSSPQKGMVAINTNFVKEDKITSYYDLLRPEWKGKIVLREPWVGVGLTWFGSALTVPYLDEEYMKALAKNGVVLMRDKRLQTEWLARGKYLVSIASDTEVQTEFKKLGIPLVDLRLKEQPLMTSAGQSFVGLFKDAPHPYAARVLINWLLGKEAQIIFSLTTNQQSIRVDVPINHVPPELRRDPKVNYLESEREEFVMKAKNVGDLAYKLFGQLRE